MRKLTQILDESSKSDFQVSVKLELENGLVLEGSFQVTDYGLSFAKDTTDKLLESNIKNIDVLNVEPIVEKVEDEIEDENISEAINPIIMGRLKDQADAGDEEAKAEYDRLETLNLEIMQSMNPNKDSE